VDPIAELNMLQLGTHVSVACQTQTTDCTFKLGLVFIGVLNTTIINLKVQAELTLPVQYVADARILDCNKYNAIVEHS